MFNQIYNEDCLEVMKKLPDNSIDLIVTSPPYAKRRAYLRIAPEQYADWFMPITKELQRVLTPKGSFILNIKEHAENGEKHWYVMDLVLRMRKEQNWKLIDEYIWHKKNSMPGYWETRLRDGWEHLFHFAKEVKVNMYQKQVKKPIGEWTKQRTKNLGINDLTRYNMQTESGFGRNMSYWKDKEEVLPDNVLYFATESSNKQHSAAFPEDIPEFFIKLFTQENNVVFDPFSGSGTTCTVAKRLGRQYLGAEINEQYYNNSIERIKKEKPLVDFMGKLENFGDE